jgi:uncharacterized protein
MILATLAGQWEARRVGVVVAAGDSIEVELDAEAPRNQALSSSGLIPFPRVGGYVLIPTDLGATVGVITSLRVDRAPFPGDSEVIPLSRRILVAAPVAEIRAADGTPSVQSGIESFPSVGDPAVVPTIEELRLVMVGVGDETDEGRIRLGVAAASSSIVVDMSIDALFGRHVAVVGTTGSGKSNTVATLIRRTVEATANASERPTPRFIVLDPNGEYAPALSDLPGFRHLVAEPVDDAHEQLTAPAWLWTVEEWCTLLRASPGVQVPILRACLSSLRWGSTAAPNPLAPLRLISRLEAILETEARRVHELDSFGLKNLGQKLRALGSDLTSAFAAPELPDAGEVCALLDELDERRAERNARGRTGYYSQFEAAELVAVLEPLSVLREQLPSADGRDDRSIDTSAPHSFDVDSLADELRREAAVRNESDNVEPLAMRVDALLQDEVARRVLAPSLYPTDVAQWLRTILGDDGQPAVTVLDLSLLPSDLTHVVAALLARFVFEAHHRHLRGQGAVAPSVIVLDEAHRFVQSRQVDEDALSAAERCRAAFSRVAREGRKFGLGLVLASQRPSEISAGILAQCGTMIVHRLSHERDQQIVHTAMAQAGSGVGRQLPALPTGAALLGGWAVRTPQLVRVDRLPEKRRPRSDDPPYWKEWTATSPRDAFGSVAEHWLGAVDATPPEEPAS